DDSISISKNICLGLRTNVVEYIYVSIVNTSLLRSHKQNMLSPFKLIILILHIFFCSNLRFNPKYFDIPIHFSNVVIYPSYNFTQSDSIKLSSVVPINRDCNSILEQYPIYLTLIDVPIDYQVLIKYFEYK
ncbi:MAG TPA: hypothetical protein VN704_11100, partial [Verrucomicrobiae bacterium]|nr:hypothetical protein [Verrucomicrobiae bacterium]